MNILQGDWPEDRIRQAAVRYEVMRRLPPQMHARVWHHTLNHSSIDAIIDRIAGAIQADSNRLLCEIVEGVLTET